MGGTLTAEDTPGGGLTVVISLPAVDRTAERADPVTRVLVVDDEPQLLRALRINLAARGYEVRHRRRRPHRRCAPPPSRHPDVVVLDLGLPDLDGTDVITALRGFSTVPIIVLSARTDSGDKVRALDRGADDYVTKPFGVDELMARLRAAVRRAAAATGGDDEPVEAGELTIDLAAKIVRRDGEDVHLTPTEWSILELLVRNRGRLVSRKQLLRRGLGARRAQGDQLPARLPGPAAPQARTRPVPPGHLITEAGMGYRFQT